MSSDRRDGSSSAAKKTLKLVRQLLQESINKEIDDVMQKYIKTYLEPAGECIEISQRAELVPTNGTTPKQCVRDACKQILEEAKKMY